MSTVPATHLDVAAVHPPLPPLPPEVFARRMDRARRLAGAAGGTALFVSAGGTNFTYLTGVRLHRSERLIALLLPVDGEPILLAPAFEVERVTRALPAALPVAVAGWEEAEDPFARAAAALAAAGAAAVPVVEPSTEYWTAAALARALPGARRVDGAPLFEALRVVKAPEELERLRRAVALTEEAFAAVFDRLAPGLRDAEIAELVAREHAARGVDGYALVQIGPQSALPHGGTIDAILAEDTVVLMDGGCRVQGYESDVARTRWFGARPPARFRALHDLIHDAQSAAIERVRPGVPCQDLDRAARAVIEKAGYGRFFTHRLGHGIGLDGHEPAYLVEGNARPLEPGFVFTVEPGVYLPGEFGVRLEEDVVCTDTGAEILTRRPPRLSRAS